MTAALVYASFSSPLGTIWLAATARGLVRLSCDEDEGEFVFELERAYGVPPEWNPGRLQTAIGQLDEYFMGTRTVFDLPLDLSRSSPFQRAVLETVRAVPYGEVQSYGDIAGAVGKPRAARAVGGVMAACPISIVIPCHRIVHSDGTNGQYAWRRLGRAGARMKEALLRLEAGGASLGSLNAAG